MAAPFLKEAAGVAVEEAAEVGFFCDGFCGDGGSTTMSSTAAGVGAGDERVAIVAVGVELGTGVDEAWEEMSGFMRLAEDSRASGVHGPRK